MPYGRNIIFESEGLGVRLRFSNIHRMIYIRHRCANQNPAPREYRLRKMAILKSQLGALIEKAKVASLMGNTERGK